MIFVKQVDLGDMENDGSIILIEECTITVDGTFPSVKGSFPLDRTMKQHTQTMQTHAPAYN